MNSSDIIRDFYSSPQGGGMAVFAGSRRQLGGSFLSGLARFALPILKFLGGKVANVAGRVVTDVIDKKPILASIKRHGVREVKQTLGAGRKRGPINKRSKMYDSDILQ